MNQRIRQLAIEAGYEKDMFGIGHWDMPECQRFAEFIVLECARIVTDAVDHCEPASTYADRIKQHFGVGE
jgi:hypothetical protein